MSIIKAQGLQLAIASTFGATKTMSAISNASEAVATLEASHGVTTGDIIELTSGWKRLTGQVVRASTISTNDVTLEDINTTSTSDYPAGEGIGTIREITAWTSLSQLLPDVSASGGGFRYADVTEIDDIRAKQLPLLAEAQSQTYNFHWDASLAWFATVRAAATSGLSVPYRISIGAQRLYGNAYWGFNPEPSIQNGVLVGQVTLATVADSVFYAS